MDHGCWAVLLEGRVERRGVEDVALYKRAPAHEIGAASGQIVECDRYKPLSGERFAGVTTDEAGTTTYKDRLQSFFALS
jgi:hypothetical protein